MKKHANGSVSLTREELYEQVWTMPIVRLAKDYGLSDRGLAKVCERHSIPRPPRGYWAKRQHGKIVQRRPLEPLADQGLVQILIRKQPRLVRSRKPKREEPIAIPVPEKPADPHTLIVRTEKSLRRARPNEKGLVCPRAKRALRVSVAPPSVGRAMSILDALVKTLDKAGFAVEAARSKAGQPSTFAVVNGERIEFRLVERVDRIAREPTDAEKRRKVRMPWLRDRTLYRYSPTGKLSLEILTAGDRGTIRKWSDLRKCRLENRLGSFIVTLKTVSRAVDRQRREREENKRRWEAFERERAERLTLILEEEKRLKQLEKEVDAWKRSQRIRAYLEAVRAKPTAGKSEGTAGVDLESWVTWAASHADRLDPLADSPPSILDEKRRWERW